MAVTITMLGDGGNPGPLRSYGVAAGAKVADLAVKIDLDASYPTGGEAVDLSDFLNTVDHIVGVEVAGDYKGEYVFGTGNAAASGKLLMRVMSTGAEVANTTDLSAVDVYLTVRGHVL